METEIERSIKAFVFDKIQEQVQLDISKGNSISIKHKSKHGSIILAMFWLRVLRHQNNYPMPKYLYKTLYDKQGNNKILLKVDCMTLTVFMDSGALTVQGVFVLEWFLDVFPKIVAAYDAPVSKPKPEVILYRQYTENWKKIQECDSRQREELKKKKEEEYAQSLAEDRSKIIAELRALEIQTYTQDQQTKPIKDEAQTGSETKDAGQVVTQMVPVGQSDTMTSTTFEEEAKMVAEEAAEEFELMTLDLWTEDILKTQLKRLRAGCVKDGPTYLYRLWRSLLNFWFSDPARKVYIVTPFLDAQRLSEVCQLVLDNRIDANLEAFCVCQQCDHDKKISQVKQAALQSFPDAKDQMFVEYKIFTSIVYPMNMFHAKFIASVKDNRAEVLVTSASFHGDHFDCSSMETVHYEIMSESEFIRGFLSPIIASVHVQK